MKWLHLSDIHFDLGGDGASTLSIRNELIDYIVKTNLQADELFVTGDFRYAKKQGISEEAAVAAADFMRIVAKKVGIDDVSKIHIVPGNHDLNRNYPTRSSILLGMKESYRVEEGAVDASDLKNAIDALEFYFLTCDKLYGKRESSKIRKEMYSSPHRVVMLSECSLLLLNTTLFCGTDHDEGELYLATKYLVQALIRIKKEAPSKPIIALGHHGISNYTKSEQRHITSVLSKYGVRLFLCGHEHELWHECIEDHVYQINTGCVKYEKGMQPSFSRGVLDLEKNSISVQAFLWDTHFKQWNVYPHFGNNMGRFEVHISYPFSDIVSFDSLHSMFEDISEYVEDANNKKHRMFGYGIDLQVALPWMEKMIVKYPNRLSFDVLVYSSCALPEQVYSVTSAFDKDTLLNAAIRMDKIRESLQQEGGEIHVRQSEVPYPFHGLVIDDRLYFTWLTIDESNSVKNQLPIHRIKIGENGIQDQYANSFVSWFRYYWDKGSDLFMTGENL